MPDRVALRMAAPAKLNLYLHIEGRRDDGLHRIDSLIAFAEAGDVVTVVPAHDLTLTADGRFSGDLPVAGDNLVLRAAGRLREAVGTDEGAELHLTKNLPVAAGIGGGSTDAAAALRLLARLWRRYPDALTDEAIARSLGADVPVCWRGRTARVSGIGERIIAMPDLPPVSVVLANPGVALPTAEVFRHHAATPVQDGPAVDAEWNGISDAATLADRLAAMRNDLETPALALAPQIADTLDALRGAPGCLLARMSGSGATCFGLFASFAGAQAVADVLRAEHPGWWVAATRLRATPPEPEKL